MPKFSLSVTYRYVHVLVNGLNPLRRIFENYPATCYLKTSASASARVSMFFIKPKAATFSSAVSSVGWLLPALDGISGRTLPAAPQAAPVPPNPLIYLDVWIFGGLILLVMGVVLVRFLWRWLHPEDRDPEEGLQPWEDPDNDFRD